MRIALPPIDEHPVPARAAKAAATAHAERSAVFEGIRRLIQRSMGAQRDLGNRTLRSRDPPHLRGVMLGGGFGGVYTAKYLMRTR